LTSSLRSSRQELDLSAQCVSRPRYTIRKLITKLVLIGNLFQIQLSGRNTRIFPTDFGASKDVVSVACAVSKPGRARWDAQTHRKHHGDKYVDQVMFGFVRNNAISLLFVIICI